MTIPTLPNSAGRKSPARIPTPIPPSHFPARTRATLERACSGQVIIPCATPVHVKQLLDVFAQFRHSYTAWQHPLASRLSSVTVHVFATSDLILLDGTKTLDASEFPWTAIFDPNPAYVTELFAHALVQDADAGPDSRQTPDRTPDRTLR